MRNVFGFFDLCRLFFSEPGPIVYHPLADFSCPVQGVFMRDYRYIVSKYVRLQRKYELLAQQAVVLHRRADGLLLKRQA